MDTGAAITLISSSIFQHLNTNGILFEPVPFPIYVADGKKLGVLGQATLEITLGPLRVEHKVVIANIQHDAILGIDFMSTHECKLDLHKSILDIHGIEVSMWTDNPEPKCCRVKLKRDEFIPARHEKIVHARVIKRGGEARYNIIEGTPRFQERTGVLVGKSLVDVSTSTVLVRLCNPSEDDIDIRAGSTVGICQPIEECIPDCDLSGPTVNQISAEPSDETEELSPHLQDLLERSSVHLTEEQKTILENKLLQYRDVFSDENGSIGRTNVVRHKINTGDSPPIRQKVRRIPMHLQKEVDSVMEDMLNKDVIEPSNSPWQSNVVLVRKKDNSLRFCID